VNILAILVDLLAAFGVFTFCAVYQDNTTRKQAKKDGKEAGPNLSALLVASGMAYLRSFIKRKPKQPRESTTA